MCGVGRGSLGHAGTPGHRLPALGLLCVLVALPCSGLLGAPGSCAAGGCRAGFADPEPARAGLVPGAYLDRSKTSPPTMRVATPCSAFVHRLPKAHWSRGSAPRRRSSARAAAARVAPRTRGDSRKLPCARDAARAAGRRLAARGQASPRVAALAGRGERARQLPGRALLAPRRSCASDRRGAGQGRARLWHEEHRRPPRPCGESRQWAQWSRARWPLPPPQPSHPARGTSRARLRAAQCPPPSRKEPSRHEKCARTARSGQLRALVRRLATPGRRSSLGADRSARGCTGAHVVAPHRMETSRVGGPSGDPATGARSSVAASVVSSQLRPSSPTQDAYCGGVMVMTGPTGGHSPT